MESDCDVKIILLGDADVGKTSLIERFVENKFKESPLKRSIHKYEKVIEIENILAKLILWDTAGREAYYNFVKGYYHIADGVLCIYDVQNANTFTAVSKWLKDFKETNKNAQILIAANKAEDGSKRSVTKNDVKTLAQTEHLDCIEVSAKENKNVNILFLHLVQKILVSKGILPYSSDSQLTKLENSETYIASSSISSEPHRTANTSSTINTSSTTYRDSTERQHTSNTTNTKSTTESLVNCVELIEQHTSNIIYEPRTTRSLVHCVEKTEQHISNSTNTPSTTEHLVTCRESTEHNLNAIESVSNSRTNVLLSENGVSESEDNEDTSWKDYDSPHDLVGRSILYYSPHYYDHARVSDQDDQSADSAESAEEFFEVENRKASLPDSHDKSTDSSLSDYGFQIITMDELTSASNEESHLADYAQSSEKEKKKGMQRKKRNVFSFFRRKKEKNVSESQ